MPPSKHFIVATAGHVDHGKSALVKALTGTDPDRLPEEKKRGITIELGFAELSLADPRGGPELHLGLVDVPGHEDFVSNMVAGVGSIDLALLVVAADDGWMPQTEEHLQILTYLGVSRGVIALTKSDLFNGQEAQRVSVEVGRQLAESPLAGAPVVMTSARTGAGLEELKSCLARVLMEIPGPRNAGKPRLAIDRAFSVRGAGTVVTGTLSGGCLRVGQSVVLEPGSRPARIRSLQVHHRDVTECEPGMRTAVNLADVAMAGHDRTPSKEGVHRGDVLTIPELAGSGKTMHVRLIRSARTRNDLKGAGRRWPDSTRVWIHHGTQRVPSRILFLEQSELVPGGSVLAELRLEKPMLAWAGDRFVVRDWAEECTLGGGVVLESEADRKRFRSPEQASFLKLRAEDRADASAFLLAQVSRDRMVRRAGLLLHSIFGEEEVKAASARLKEAGQIADVDGWLIEQGFWQEARTALVKALDEKQREHPERTGVELAELRPALPANLSQSPLFEVLMADLCRGELKQTGTTLSRVEHRPALSPQLQKAAERIRAALEAKPFEPPSKKELAPDQLSQAALRFLRESGETMELSDELVMRRVSFDRMQQTVVAFISKHGRATVSELRQCLGTTRRIIMPVLERLDREGVTQRQGDYRVLGRKSSARTSS